MEGGNDGKKRKKKERKNDKLIKTGWWRYDGQNDV